MELDSILNIYKDEDKEEFMIKQEDCVGLSHLWTSLSGTVASLPELPFNLINQENAFNEDFYNVASSSCPAALGAPYFPPDNEGNLLQIGNLAESRRSERLITPVIRDQPDDDEVMSTLTHFGYQKGKFGMQLRPIPKTGIVFNLDIISDLFFKKALIEMRTVEEMKTGNPSFKNASSLKDKIKEWIKNDRLKSLTESFKKEVTKLCYETWKFYYK